MTCHYSFLTQNPRQSSDSPRDKKARSSCKRGGVFLIFKESQYTLRSFLLSFARCSRRECVVSHPFWKWCIPQLMLIYLECGSASSSPSARLSSHDQSSLAKDVSGRDIFRRIRAVDPLRFHVFSAVAQGTLDTSNSFEYWGLISEILK